MMYNKRIGGLNYLNKVICMNITKRQFGIADSLMDMANSRIGNLNNILSIIILMLILRKKQG